MRKRLCVFYTPVDSQLSRHQWRVSVTDYFAIATTPQQNMTNVLKSSRQLADNGTTRCMARQLIAQPEFCKYMLQYVDMSLASSHWQLLRPWLPRNYVESVLPPWRVSQITFGRSFLTSISFFGSSSIWLHVNSSISPWRNNISRGTSTHNPACTYSMVFF